MPGLDAALKYHGMSRSEHSFRAGMTPGEVLDYEIGAKSPTAEIVGRLADALGAAPHELAFPPAQVEAHRIQEERDNARITEQRLNMSANEILEEVLRNPGARLIRDALEKKDAEREAEREDDTA